MRVLFDATPLQTGHRDRGIGAYARHLLQALFAVDRETEYLLIAHPDPPLALDFGAARTRLIPLPRPNVGRLTAFVTHQALLPALLLRVQADLFHSPGFTAAFSVPGIPWLCPMPLVVTLHDFIPLHLPALSLHKPINRAWYAWQRRLARRATALICVSEATRQEALRFVAPPAERLVVVHEGVDRRVFRPRAPTERPGDGLPTALSSAARPYILFVGGDYANKNRPAALAAFSRLVQATVLPHHLVLVGPDRASAAELAQRYPGLDLRRVHRLPHVTQAELAALYRHADAFLFPSTHEGFGLPLLEAMASGTPVVAGNASALPEVAGDAALLVDPYDVDAIAMALAQVLSEPALRSRLVSAGLARAAAFTWERAAHATLEVYRAAAGQGTTSPSHRALWCRRPAGR